MDAKLFGSVFVATLKEFGVTIDKIDDNGGQVTILISVPETSDRLSVNGEPISGMYLAKKIKATLVGFGIKNLTVKAKIRKGECWPR